MAGLRVYLWGIPCCTRIAYINQIRCSIPTRSSHLPSLAQETCPICKAHKAFKFNGQDSLDLCFFFFSPFSLVQYVHTCIPSYRLAGLDTVAFESVSWLCSDPLRDKRKGKKTIVDRRQINKTKQKKNYLPFHIIYKKDIYMC